MTLTVAPYWNRGGAPTNLQSMTHDPDFATRFIIPVQRKLGLVEDGLDYEKTWTAIQKALAVGSEPASPVPATPGGSSGVLTGLIRNDWPKEADAETFFGYPPNLTQVDLPYPMHLFEAAGETVTRISCNVKVAASLRRILGAIMEHFQTLSAIHAVGADVFDGVYNDRNVRGASHKSMHAFGAAIDIDAEHNPLGAETGRMAAAVVTIFKSEGWRWGGDYHGRKDWVHFEACS